MNFFRLQIGHYTIGEMQSYVSQDGGDDCEVAGGLCACRSISDLMRNTVWEVKNIPGAEVVVFAGDRIADIYDGARVYPLSEIYRVNAIDIDDEEIDKLMAMETW